MQILLFSSCLFTFQPHLFTFLFQVPFTVIHAMGDEFMSCDSYSRRESRVLEAIPCDMTTTNYCKIKGPSYPE